MKRILLVSGSPRLEGNTNQILKGLSLKFGDLGFCPEIINLSLFNIEMCNGCLVCEETDCTGYCSIRDDFSGQLVDKFINSNFVIFGTPVYFDMPSALLVNFIDRLNMHLKTIESKSMRAGIVAVGQTNLNSVMNCVECVKRFINIAGMQEIDCGVIAHIARDIGDVDIRSHELLLKIDAFANSVSMLEG